MWSLALLLLLQLSLAWGFSLQPRLGLAVPRVQSSSSRLCGSGGGLVECTDDSCVFLDEVKEGIVVVDFYANWCGPCKIAAKTFAAIAEEFPDKSVKFVKVDTETHESTVDDYGLKGLPVFGVFKNGKLVKKHEGNIGKDKLLEFINSGIKE